MPPYRYSPHVWVHPRPSQNVSGATMVKRSRWMKTSSIESLNDWLTLRSRGSWGAHHRRCEYNKLVSHLPPGTTSSHLDIGGLCDTNKSPRGKEKAKSSWKLASGRQLRPGWLRSPDWLMEKFTDGSLIWLGVQSKQSAVDVANLTPVEYSSSLMEEDYVERGCVPAQRYDLFRMMSWLRAGRLLLLSELFWFIISANWLHCCFMLCQVCLFFRACSANGRNVALIIMQHFLPTICI